MKKTIHLLSVIKMAFFILAISMLNLCIGIYAMADMYSEYYSDIFMKQWGNALLYSFIGFIGFGIAWQVMLFITKAKYGMDYLEWKLFIKFFDPKMLKPFYRTNRKKRKAFVEKHNIDVKNSALWKASTTSRDDVRGDMRGFHFLQMMIIYLFLPFSLLVNSQSLPWLMLFIMVPFWLGINQLFLWVSGSVGDKCRPDLLMQYVEESGISFSRLEQEFGNDAKTKQKLGMDHIFVISDAGMEIMKIDECVYCGNIYGIYMGDDRDRFMGPDHMVNNRKRTSLDVNLLKIEGKNDTIFTVVRPGDDFVVELKERIKGK